MKKITLILSLLSFMILTMSFDNIFKINDTLDCKDYLNDARFVKKSSLEFGKKHNLYEIHEIYNKESEDRFLMLIENKSKYTCNHKSLLNNRDYQGFSMDKLLQTKKGFSFSIEYGSRYYKRTVFKFELIKEVFYLREIKTISFDKENPSKSEKHCLRNKLDITFEKFDIYNFIN